MSVVILHCRMLEYSPGRLSLFLDGLVRLLYQLFKDKKCFEGQMILVTMWHLSQLTKVI